MAERNSILIAKERPSPPVCIFQKGKPEEDHRYGVAMQKVTLDYIRSEVLDDMIHLYTPFKDFSVRKLLSDEGQEYWCVNNFSFNRLSLIRECFQAFEVALTKGCLAGPSYIEPFIVYLRIIGILVSDSDGDGDGEGESESESVCDDDKTGNDLLIVFD